MIYFVRSGNAVKIGYAGDPVSRIRALQTANPSKLAVLGVMPGDLMWERLLHLSFSHLHIRGEWFHMNEEIVGYVERRCRPHFIRRAAPTNSRAAMPALAQAALWWLAGSAALLALTMVL